MRAVYSHTTLNAIQYYLNVSKGHRYTRGSQTAPGDGVVSQGLKLGVFEVFADHTRKNKSKTNASTIFACCAAFYACFIFMLRPQKMQVAYKPDEPL